MRLSWSVLVSGVFLSCSGSVVNSTDSPSDPAGGSGGTGANGGAQCTQAAEKFTRDGPCAASGLECGVGCGTCDPWLTCRFGRCYSEQGIGPADSILRALYFDEGEGERFLIEEGGVLERLEVSLYREEGDVDIDIYLSCGGTIALVRHALVPYENMPPYTPPDIILRPVGITVDPPLAVAKGDTLDVMFRAAKGGSAVGGLAYGDPVANGTLFGYNGVPGIVDPSECDYEIKLFVHPSDQTLEPGDAGANWDPGSPELCASAAEPIVKQGPCASLGAECGDINGQSCGVCASDELCQAQRCFKTVGLGPNSNPGLLRRIQGGNGEGQRMLVPWTGTMEYVEAAIWAEPGEGIAIDIYRTCGNRLMLARSLEVPASNVALYPDEVGTSPMTLQKIDPPLGVNAGDVINVLLHPTGQGGDVIGIVTKDVSPDGLHSGFDTHPGMGAPSDWDAVVRVYVHE